jgi:ubiquinone/menaquinone biosynthesis C-methylase UbiE
MGLFGKYIAPRVVHLACSTKPLLRQRAKVVPLARGSVLEVGFGSGLNLPFYDAGSVSHVWALDPSAEMWALAGQRVRTVDFSVEFVKASAEEIPLRDQCADTVLITYTLCTLPDVRQALREMARVLKLGGDLIFCEHSVAPDDSVRRWQNRLNPVWRVLGSGCNLNRPIPSLLEQGGFRLQELSSMYLPGWRPASYNYWGRAAGP